jgi:hypothetical protein
MCAPSTFYSEQSRHHAHAGSGQQMVRVSGLAVAWAMYRRQRGGAAYAIPMRFTSETAALSLFQKNASNTAPGAR